MEVSQIIDKNYQVIKHIKSGGFGIVYLGWDIVLDRSVAIKEIHPFLFEDDQFIKMFQDEARNTAKLNHPNIVHVYSLRKTAENRFYIIMEYIEGLDLRIILKNLISQNKIFPTEIAIAIMIDVCKALEYAHSKCDEKSGQPLLIVHRDVSPSNIIISVDGAVKLIDFGIAKARFRSIEKSGLGFIKGKLPYMAPEQVAGKEHIDHRTDLFSVGVILFELLSNEKLFNSENTFTLMKDVENVNIDKKRIYNLNATDEIKNIILKCIQKKCDNRYQNAAEIITQLESELRTFNSFDTSSKLKFFIREIVTEDETLKSKISVPTEEFKTTDRTQFVETQEITSHVNKSATAGKPYTPPASVTTPYVDEPDETEKTIFDVVKITSRTYKKQIYAGLISLSVLFILFLALDVINRWTSMGQSIYDIFYPPSLFVKSVPAGSNIYLDGELVGKTSNNSFMKISDIKPGSHELRLMLSGFDPVIMSLEVPSRGAITKKGADDTKLGKSISIQFNTKVELHSVPPNADIIINGEATQYKTPYVLSEWPIGEPLNIEMRLPGFDPITNCIFNSETGSLVNVDKRIWHLAKTSVDKFEYLIEGKFTKPVQFKSLPANAEVYLNNQTELVTTTGTDKPIRLTVGEYLVTYKKPGFLDRNFQISVNKNSPSIITRELSRIVNIAAVDYDSPRRDINAKIVSIYSKRSQQFPKNTSTPAKLEFEYIDHYVKLHKNTYNDTTVSVSTRTNSVTVKMRHIFMVNVVNKSTGDSINEGQIVYKEANAPDATYRFFDLIKNGVGKRSLKPGYYTFKINCKDYFPAEQNGTVDYQINNSVTFLLEPIPEN